MLDTVIQAYFNNPTNPAELFPSTVYEIACELKSLGHTVLIDGKNEALSLQAFSPDYAASYTWVYTVNDILDVIKIDGINALAAFIIEECNRINNKLKEQIE